MIDHLSLGVSELARSRRFYDTALGVLGYLLLSADDSFATNSDRVDRPHQRREQEQGVTTPFALNVTRRIEDAEDQQASQQQRKAGVLRHA